MMEGVTLDWWKRCIQSHSKICSTHCNSTRPTTQFHICSTYCNSMFCVSHPNLCELVLSDAITHVSLWEMHESCWLSKKHLAWNLFYSLKLKIHSKYNPATEHYLHFLDLKSQETSLFPYFLTCLWTSSTLYLYISSLLIFPHHFLELSLIVLTFLFL